MKYSFHILKGKKTTENRKPICNKNKDKDRSKNSRRWSN